MPIILKDIENYLNISETDAINVRILLDEDLDILEDRLKDDSSCNILNNAIKYLKYVKEEKDKLYELVTSFEEDLDDTTKHINTLFCENKIHPMLIKEDNLNYFDKLPQEISELIGSKLSQTSKTNYYSINKSIYENKYRRIKTNKPKYETIIFEKYISSILKHDKEYINYIKNYISSIYFLQTHIEFYETINVYKTIDIFTELNNNKQILKIKLINQSTFENVKEYMRKNYNGLEDGEKIILTDEINPIEIVKLLTTSVNKDQPYFNNDDMKKIFEGNFKILTNYYYTNNILLYTKIMKNILMKKHINNLNKIFEKLKLNNYENYNKKKEKWNKEKSHLEFCICETTL